MRWEGDGKGGMPVSPGWPLKLAASSGAGRVAAEGLALNGRVPRVAVHTSEYRVPCAREWQVAKDRPLFGPPSSDPYVKVQLHRSGVAERELKIDSTSKV